MNQYIEAHLDAIRTGDPSPRTITARAQVLYGADYDLRDKFGYGLLQASEDELIWWFTHYTWKPSTRRAYMSHIQQFFAWAVKTAYIDLDPSAELHRPKAPKGLPKPATDDEVAFLLDQSPADWRTIVVLGAYAGLRCAEIRNLSRDDVNPSTIRVQEGKGQIGRAHV